jgi:putative ABC transport system permease protein
VKAFIILKQSLKAIFTNKTRSFLTMLGIIIGIGSVIALIGLGEGVTASISDRINTLGTTTLTIMPGAGFTSNMQSAHSGGGTSPAAQTGAASTLTDADMTSLGKVKDVKAVSGNVTGSMIAATDQGDKRFTVTGAGTEYFSIQGFALDKGVLFDDTDVTAAGKVIVVGSQVKTDVYGAKDPIGETLRIGEEDYIVIGTLKNNAENGFSNPNNQAYIPYTSAKASFKTENLSNITVQAKNEDVVESVKKNVTKTLLANHGIAEEKLADFNIMTAVDLLSTMTTITGLMTSLLAGIAAISLLVGGIGIMNIMLVSVTERTREIGLRKAVGAKTIDIMGQFVTEALLLTLVGGVLGIGFGYLMAEAFAAMIKQFSPVITLQSVLLAAGVSSAVGLIFGIYPAAKAARLNPIDALRYE